MQGDILIPRRGDFSRYAYVDQQHDGWLCGTGCLLLRLQHTAVDNYFLAISLGTDAVQDYFRQSAVGSIMPNLNTKILEGMPVALPPLSEQQAIGQALRRVDHKAEMAENHRRSLDSLFNTLLQNLVTGRVRVGEEE